ncbi:MAG: type 3 dihydrofolate reductase [Gammaproteobacteria bacterium]
MLNAIVAMSQNRVIGINNQLPWHLPADLAHFKKTTLGHAILMGRKTFDSIGKPLPNRTNIVLSRDQSLSLPGCQVVHSLEQALEQTTDNSLFLIGGATLYQQFLPKISRLYLTIIHKEFEGDAFFPELNLNEWQEVHAEHHQADDKNPYDYSFYILSSTSPKDC